MASKVRFLDLSIEEPFRRELLEVVDAVFRHGRIVLGPEVEAFEKRTAEYCGRKHAVGVSSGTDALLMGLKSVGIAPGDEVITTSLSWIATTNAIVLAGATPVFADIGDDLNIDPGSVERLISPRTKAIVPVHYTGKICKVEALLKLAEGKDVLIIEDAAQAFGARRHGRVAGSFGSVACFSMNPMKVFAACGEAGVVVTDSDEVRERLVSLRYNGTVNREMCIEPSLNARLDTIQAAILLKRFDHVQDIIEKRREIAGWYEEMLTGVVNTPKQLKGEEDVYYTYTIRADRRDELKAFLERKGIETKIQHPFLMPDQPAYKDKVREDYPNARRLVKRVLCIPANEKTTRQEVEYVASAIREFYHV